MKYVDYNLLIEAERIRFQSDFSSAHWLHQVISRYEEGITNDLRRDAYERVLRTAIRVGCKAAIKLANTFPPIAGFPDYLRLVGGPEWKTTRKAVLKNFEVHKVNRFPRHRKES